MIKCRHLNAFQICFICMSVLLHVCLCTSMHGTCRGQKSVLDTLDLEFSLHVSPGNTTSAIAAFNCGAYLSSP